MPFKLGLRSRAKLNGVHPDLVRVVERAILLTDLDFVVLEGLRSLARQKQLFESGASTTLDSRHLTGHAVDLAPVVGKVVRWDWPLYRHLAAAMSAAAKAEGVSVEWGGDWTNFKDGPHWQLPRHHYPQARWSEGGKLRGEAP